jgi:predicted Zn-dependent protease
MPEANDPKSLARLESLAKPLIDQCQRKLILYKIRIVKSSKINAFGCAGGHVYITTTFLKRFTTDEELAMTLGHEIAHVELKHAVHKVQYLYRTRKTLGEAANIGQVAYAVLSAPYTKDQEFEADAVGFDACRKVGWETAKLLALFEGFSQLEQEQAKSRVGGATETGSDLERKAGDYFSTHPGAAERLVRLKARASA